MAKSRDIRYPYKELPPQPPGDRSSSVGEPLAAGATDAAGEVVRSIAEARRQLTRIPVRKAPPKWVLSYVERDAPLEELVERLKTRARSMHSARGQAEAVAIINELGRSKKGAALVREGLTQDLLDAITEDGREVSR